jgi:hypothetical protein
MLQAYDPAALGQQVNLPAVEPKALGLALSAQSLKSPAPAPAAAQAPTLPASASPQLIAAQQKAQMLAQALQANQQGGQNLHGGVAEFGARLLAQALLSGETKKANTDVAQAQIARAQAIAQQLHPGDSNFATLMSLDPDGAVAASLKGYEPIDVRQGNTVLNAPGSVAGTQGSAPNTYTAPTMQDDGGQMGMLTAGGYTPLGQRAPNYGEATSQQQANTAQASQQEQAAQNQRSNTLTQQGLGIQAQQAQASMAQAAAAQAQARAAGQQAATGAGNLGLQQQTSPTFALPQGYVLNGAPR